MDVSYIVFFSTLFKDCGFICNIEYLVIITGMCQPCKECRRDENRDRIASSVLGTSKFLPQVFKICFAILTLEPGF